MKITCPAGTEWVGPDGSGGLEITVNGRAEGGCARPDGTRHGPWNIWYADGSRAACGTYDEGLKDGEWCFWHENGQISGQGHFSAGKPVGEWTAWHDNGVRASKGTYVDGLQHGPFIRWSPNGETISEGLEDGTPPEGMSPTSPAPPE